MSDRNCSTLSSWYATIHCSFLVGAFQVKSAQPLQWLVFFRQTTDCLYTFLCTVHFYQEYLILDFEHIQSL